MPIISIRDENGLPDINKSVPFVLEHIVIAGGDVPVLQRAQGGMID